MKQYFFLPMIWYYCLMERKMIYDDFHSFMLFYFLCLLLTHLILFHISLLLLSCRKNRLFNSPSLSFSLFFLAWQHFCIYTRKLIWEESFSDEKKLNHRSVKITFMGKLISLEERFIWSQKFPQIMQFSKTINHFKPECKRTNSSLCPVRWLKNAESTVWK
jgi:hypothetical protein